MARARLVVGRRDAVPRAAIPCEPMPTSVPTGTHTPMHKSRFSAAQIIGILRAGSGSTHEEVCPRHGLVDIGGTGIKAFVFVATLGHSRRCHVRAFRHEKQKRGFSGLESAFLAFGGVPEEVLTIRVPWWWAMTRCAARSRSTTSSSPSPGTGACAPFRARTKGKIESGVAT